MPITHRQLEAFRMFMETGSVTAAAERMRVTQPAVSKILAGLEMDLKLQLFIREKKRLVPTDEAELLHQEVLRIMSSLAEVENFADDLRNLRAGELRIATAASVGQTLIADTIAHFSAQHPKTRMLFYITSGVGHSVMTQQVDIGFSFLRFQHPLLHTQPLFYSRAVCIVPAGHRLAEKEVVSPEDLRDEQFISFMRDSRMRHIIDALFESRGVARQTQYDVYSSGEACALVERGVGVSIVEPLGVAYRQPPGIAVCRLEPAIHFTFNMLLPRFKKASRLTDRFVADLKTRIVQFGNMGDPKGLCEIELAVEVAR
ncbi:MAG: LysR substrate-binding domain-containing protein [Neoaquamicrobium sediminum]|uniref:LysR substrate-binding domain-containing protein n=1 Tax=Neoaquamicrobium sediminum TaxID=1849104 RepID=UPI0040364901